MINVTILPYPNRIESSRSTYEAPNSTRSNPANSARTDNLETFRTSMDTARVHTALAALTAEKQSLLSKLQLIDSALDTGKKKQIRQVK